MILKFVETTAFMMNLKNFLLPYTVYTIQSVLLLCVCLCASVDNTLYFYDDVMIIARKKNIPNFVFYSCEKLETNRIIILIFMRRNVFRGLKKMSIKFSNT